MSLMNKGKLTWVIISLALLSFGMPGKKKITVWLCGDSTMSIKDPRYYPETGWGMPFVYFFDSTVTVDNKAKNGRSTKTFISEKLWQSVIDNAKEGDYVFIQFGHNDEAKEKVERYTTPEEYKANLLKFINGITKFQRFTRELKSVLVHPLQKAFILHRSAGG